MVYKKKLLTINELQVGMVSASNITSNGKVLLADGVIITDSILNKLKNIYIIHYVEVYTENSDTVETLSFKEKTVKEIEISLTEFSLNLQAIFNVMSKLDAYDIEEIKAFSKKIQEEFKSVGSIIRNIIFYGSGDDCIYRHSINVTAISFILGKWIGLKEKELDLLTYSAVLHDFGKTKLDKFLIAQKNKMDCKDNEATKTHPVLGYKFIKKIPNIDSNISYSVLMHHERADGSGYPLHITGDKINKYAKIIAIADLFDEVSSNRYSEKIKGPFDALKVIQDQSLTKLDTNFCNIFLNHIVNYYLGENVLLNDNRSCKVVQIQMNNLTKPLLLNDSVFLDLTKEKNLFVEKLVVS